MSMKKPSPAQEAQFRFGLIAPVIQGLYPDASAAAYYRRVTEEPVVRPDGTSFRYSPQTLERWASRYKKDGIDALLPKERSDKGYSRKLDSTAIEGIYNLRNKYPKAAATMIHAMLLEDGLITEDVSVRAVQRFIKSNDLKSARDPNVRDRKAYEMPEFGCMWQADTAYTPYITEDGVKRRTYVMMIIDDHSRMIVGGGAFYSDSAYNFQKVLKAAIATYGIPDKLMLDNGASYANAQLSLILAAVGCAEIHNRVRDAAAKGKVERNFRTMRTRFVNVTDFNEFHSLEELNNSLAAYIRRHNTTVHSGTGEKPFDRYLRTKSHIRAPKSSVWLDECFMNRITRKVGNDSCISIDKGSYDAPMQFIGMKVDIRYLPGRMEDAYILYEGVHYPICRTNKNDNANTKRKNDLPEISYSKKVKDKHE